MIFFICVLRFLWTLYSNESGTHIVRAEFQSAMKIEGTLQPNNRPNQWWDHNVISLFGVGQDRIGFEHFRAWIQYNKVCNPLFKKMLHFFSPRNLSKINIIVTCFLENICYILPSNVFVSSGIFCFCSKVNFLNI